MKFSPVSLRKQARGFTLVELLIVIVIIVTLASFGMLAANVARTKADAMKAKKVCTDLVSAIENFQIEHNGVLPLDSFSDSDGDEHINTDDTSSLIRILTNRETGERTDKVNQSGKTYFSAEEVTQPAGGIYVSGKGVALYDPWRKPYYIVIDTDGDEQVIDPNDASKKRKIHKKVVVYSYGPDGEYGTMDKNDDNVYSHK